jgi:hypothetical protein
MTDDKVLLLELKERTSASGNRYLSGWLGRASVVAFLDKDAAEPTSQVYVSTPKPRHGDAPMRGLAIHQNRDGYHLQPHRAAKAVPAGMLDDSIDELGNSHG